MLRLSGAVYLKTLSFPLSQTSSTNVSHLTNHHLLALSAYQFHSSLPPNHVRRVTAVRLILLLPTRVPKVKCKLTYFNYYMCNSMSVFSVMAGRVPCRRKPHVWRAYATFWLPLACVIRYQPPDVALNTSHSGCSSQLMWVSYTQSSRGAVNRGRR